MRLPHAWEAVAFGLCHAFQPIARFQDGSAYGFEALLRGWDRLGFSSIKEVFDLAYEDKVLYELDLALRAKAFSSFASARVDKAKLFYNIDTRLLEMADYAPGNTLRLAAEAGLPSSRIVIELSELLDPGQRTPFDEAVASYRNQGFRIALDDFGSGYAGLKLLHRAAPDIVKIDRYFVAGADADPRKATFIEKIAGMAHLMGIAVVAEGIETEGEGLACAQAGCDYIQGYLLARPSLDICSLRSHYETALDPGLDQPLERRSSSRGWAIRKEMVSQVEAVGTGTGLPELLARFRKAPDISAIPVVNAEGEPVGVFRERDFREYVYSPFGISLLEHQVQKCGQESLLVPASVLPVGSELTRAVSAYGLAKEAGCIVMTEAGRYAGIIPAGEILSVVAERELVEARDQNPLSRLPGNLRVAEVCAERLGEPGRGVAFAYYDFDNFKPFNDRYGFRSGDRVIMLFADILRSSFGRPGDFIGHLGGDDFFACVEAPVDGEEGLSALLESLLEPSRRFAREASSFYSAEDRERGWVPGKTRDGRRAKMSLLGASLAVVHLQPGGRLDADGLSALLADLKRAAKASEDHVASSSIGPSQGADSPGEGGSGEAAQGKAPRAGSPGGRSSEPVFTASLLAAW